MSRFVRHVRKSKWYASPAVPWLKEGELQADALFDFEARSNRVSVWKLEDDGSNLGRIIAGMAATRDTLANWDYAVIDQKDLDDIGIDITRSRGVSVDDEANDRWHWDLVELTADKVYRLAQRVQQSAIERVLRKRVASLVSQAISCGWIDRKGVSEAIMEKIEQL